jgi:hypothetical protein
MAKPQQSASELSRTIAGQWTKSEKREHASRRSTMAMKLWETTIKINGREFKDRVGAETAQEARMLLQQRHGPRAVPYLPHMIPS